VHAATTHRVVLVVTLVVAGCSRGPREGDGRGGEAPSVRAEAVQRGGIGRDVVATAAVESQRSVDLVAETTGLVASLPVEEGDVVRAGQLLCAIHNPMTQVALERAALEVEQLKSELASTTRLDEKGFVSRRTREDIEFRLRRAELELQRNDEELRRQRVVAPFGGVIARRYVTAGEQVVPQRRLLTLVDHNDLRVVLAVPESQMKNLVPGLPVELRSVATDARVVGQVQRLAPVVEARSGTVRVTASVPAGQGLLPGMLVAATIRVEQRDGVLLVPRRALDLDSPLPTLYRLQTRPGEGGVQWAVERVAPQLGIVGDEQVEILSGLADGERVVVAGQSALRDGIAVRVVGEAGAPGEDAAGAAPDR
jgi:membrane fusion protein (multidrug efflux system)